MIREMTRGGALAVLGLAACSPPLDWREVRPIDSDVTALFPCKPQRLSRPVTLAGAKVQMDLVSCSAKDATYALAYARMPEPVQVSHALRQLRAAASANIGASAPSTAAWTVPGMTPNPLAEKLSLAGRGADGKSVQEQAVFFVKGLRIYQATLVGPEIDAQAAETFFNGLKLSS
ncbi:MAG TPA: hypothetical protein VF169_24555 [Albitalea sp.]|uniref:hypothetical protein n=1 Tax=Piscinibacter sp. TaxID=1903157 RepID=UPI002ED071E7